MDSQLEKLFDILAPVTGLSKEDFSISIPYWQSRSYKKEDFFNKCGSVCTYAGLVVNGIFRSYVINEKTGEEKNVFFYPPNYVLVSFNSFISQQPSEYFTQALADSTILCINYKDALSLCDRSHAWERTARILLQELLKRTQVWLKQINSDTPEERYQKLIDCWPDIVNEVPMYHIASYLGIQGPSLSRIRKRMAGRPKST